MIPKPTRVIDEEYLDYIRKQPCLVCRHDSDPHHLVTRKAFGSDYTAIPLCRNHHTEIGWGIGKFELKYKINLWKDAHRLLERWMTTSQ